MQTRSTPITILMLPWLAHGHISPYFELAKKLAPRNFTIHICSTPVNLTSVRSKIPEKLSSSIQLKEIHLDPHPELPPHRHTTNGLPPHLMPTLKAAFDTCGPKLDVIMEELRPDLVVYDFLLPWAAEVAKSRGVPGVCFMSVSAGMSCYVIHALKRLNGEVVEEEFPFKDDIYLEDGVKHVFEQLMEASSGGLKDKDRFLQCVERSTNIMLMKTFRELEDKYIDYLSELLGKKVVPVGPLVQDPVNDSSATHITEWLDTKPESSTIFVSFGTEYFLSKPELEDIALGLELSHIDFIWVVRFPSGEQLKLDEVLPEGFLERVRGRGLVVENWAPQARILAHRSIGGFVSHCGWSSVMESMKLGVPIIAMAMQLDQPLNAKVVEEVGVGVEVRRNPKSGRFDKEEIGRVVREVVVGSGGERVRRRVKEVSESIGSKGDDEEIDGVVHEFVKILRGVKEVM